jgi:uncharacterized cupin superfamily protein
MAMLHHGVTGLPGREYGAPRAFTDLRTFARDTSQGHTFINWAWDDAFLSSRRLLDMAPGPVSAGAITLDEGSGQVRRLPADEFVIVCDGYITLAQDGRRLTLEAGGSAVIPHGAAFAWTAEQPVSLAFLRYNHSQPGDGVIVPVAEQPAAAPSHHPLGASWPAPAWRNHTDYRSASGEFSCGAWDATPYARRAMARRKVELMYLLEGSVAVADETGRRNTFTRGDIFIVEQHAQCRWEYRGNVAKVYAAYQPA